MKELKSNAVGAIRNIFAAISAKDPNEFENNANRELENPLYHELTEELQMAAGANPKLARILAAKRR
jgi:hypothetical protein